MRKRHPGFGPSRQRTRIVILAVVALLSVEFSGFGQTSTVEARASKPLEIENPTFQASGLDRMPVESWNFEAITVKADADALKLDVDISKKNERGLSIPGEGRGAILECGNRTHRADLVSAAFELKPFRSVDVTVAYQVEKGEPVPFVCLRPWNKREWVDVGFLPRSPAGKKRTTTVKLHSGLSNERYVLTMACIGQGAVRFLSVRGDVTGEYPRPEQPVFVLDMLHLKPRPTSELGWPAISKLVTVFGFPAIESLHYSKVSAEKLEEIDPALIVLSPKGEEIPRQEAMKMLDGAQIAVDHGAPVVGICLGHQVLAMLRGGKLGAAMEEGDDGKRKILWEWGPTMLKAVKEDPLFENLPRYPRFCASESHRGIVCGEVEGAILLASTEHCKTQVFRYEGEPWYTFQAHIERGWGDACPEACLLWKNMLRYFFLIP